jgi:Lon protease-like protein
MAKGLLPFQPALGELDATIPVFPLPGAMLLPHGRLPLNIFEMRYLAMVEDAMGAGRMFGMIQPDSLKAPVAHGSATFNVGCLGRITSFTETEDGRIVLSLLGVIRFAVVEEVAPRRGYRRMRVDYASYAGDLDVPSGDIGLPRQALLASLRGYFERQGVTADWDSIGEMDDQTLLTALCMMCPFAPSEKQALLEADSPAQRTQILQALLAFGMHDPEPDGGTQRLS